MNCVGCSLLLDANYLGCRKLICDPLRLRREMNALHSIVFRHRVLV